MSPPAGWDELCGASPQGTTAPDVVTSVSSCAPRATCLPLASLPCPAVSVFPLEQGLPLALPLALGWSPGRCLSLSRLCPQGRAPCSSGTETPTFLPALGEQSPAFLGCSWDEVGQLLGASGDPSPWRYRGSTPAQRGSSSPETGRRCHRFKQNKTARCSRQLRGCRSRGTAGGSLLTRVFERPERTHSFPRVSGQEPAHVGIVVSGKTPLG